jgi:glycosyltransferase involved in cell wall biosynthesis
MTVIVFNALALRPGGAGLSTYTRGLLGAMRAEVDAELVAVVQADAVDELPPGIRPQVRPALEGVPRALEGLRPYGDATVTHGLNVALPVRAAGVRVITVHDLAYFDLPSAVSRGRALSARLLWRRSLRLADGVIAPSQFTADRLQKRFAITATVVAEAVDEHFSPPGDAVAESVRHKYDLPERFVLQVGTIEPRKDVPGLLAACERAGLPLVLAGARWGASDLAARARTLGFVPIGDLPGLYAIASVVAYPSRYEGFGLPPLEAMACGAAVVASQIPPLVELLADAAELVPVGDEEALAQRLRDVASDPDRRREMIERGLVRAAQFSWKQAAASTAAVYRALGAPV